MILNIATDMTIALGSSYKFKFKYKDDETLYDGGIIKTDLQQMHVLFTTGIGLVQDSAGEYPNIYLEVGVDTNTSPIYSEMQPPIIFKGSDPNLTPWIKLFAVKHVVNIIMYDIDDNITLELIFNENIDNVRDITFDKLIEFRVSDYAKDIEVLWHDSITGRKSHMYPSHKTVSQSMRGVGSFGRIASGAIIPSRNGIIVNDTIITDDMHMYALGSLYKF